MEPEPLNQSSSLNLDTVVDDGLVDTPVWQRGGRVYSDVTSRGDGRAGDIFTKEFLRKYIHYAKNRVHPVLSEEAMESISSSYANMRAR